MNKKNMKKWMALFLSLAMILTSGVLTISPGLLASEKNTYENSAYEDSQGASEENAEAQQTSQEAQIPEAQNSSGESAAESQQSEQTSEPAAQETETNNEAVSMPAQSFRATASNGVTVKVNAPEGALPAGSTMHVTAVSAKTAKNIASQTASHEVKDAVGVDITFRDSSGKETEPAAAVDVHMYLSSKLEGDSFTVSHKADSGNVSQVSASASAGGASFSESSFSIYVISGEGEENIPVATYNFHDANGAVIDTQNVKTGDTLNKPSSPEKEGYKLVGWSTTKDASTPDFDGFGKVTVNKEETINVYPVFQEVHYVFFMDGTDDSSRVSTTKEGVEGGKISTTDVKLPLESTKSVTGWYTDKALTSPAGDTVTLGTKNIKLYPKIEEGHYLQFASGEGATYIAPQFVAANKGTKKPSDPKRPGYTFVGWSTEKNGTTANFNFGDTISEDTTVYAVWKAKANTSYTVIYWKQSVEDSKNAKDSQKTYEYAGSDSRTGTTGSTVSPSYTDRNKNYKGFKYNSSKSQSVTVAGDGTTILNVYYDRELLTINFYGDQYKYVPTTSSYGWGTTYYGLVNGQYVELQSSWGGSDWYYKSNGRYYRYNGTRYTRETTEDKETFTGLYGQTLAQNGYTWPSQKDWYNSSKNNHLTFLDAFIFDTLDEYGTSTEINLYGYDPRGNYTISHYKQNLDGSYSYDDPANSTSVNGGTFYFSNKYNGFTINSYSTNGTNWNNTSAGSSVKYDRNLYVRYSRNSYKLTYYNYNKTDKDVDVLYEAPLSGYASYVPEKPADLPDGYTFKGWYKDKECTVPFDFNSTMPVNDVMVYAKWAAPEVNGKAYLTVNGGDSVDLQLEYGDKIDSSQLPSVYDSQGHLVQTGSSKKIVIPAGYDWKGWATKDGDSFILFNFNTEIYSDIELYPFYVSNGKYKVEYSAGAGTGSVEDSKLYAEGSHADVQYASAIKAPAGKVFLYWQSESGSHYYPDDKIAVNSTNAGDDKVITLTAVYGSKAAATKLTYKSNYPDKAIDENGSEISAQTYDQKYNGSTDLNNNTRLKTLTIGQTGFTLPLEYQFTGWNTKADGSGKAIAAKASADQMADILVDNKGDNILYAQWTKKPVTEITVKPEDKSKTYDGTALKADSYKITGGSLGEGDKIVATYSGSQTDAGSSDSSFATFKIMHNGKVDVTSKLYKVTLQKGKLEVTKRKVTLTTGSDEKTYDGTPLTKAGVTVSGDEFVDGEVSDIKATGSRTDAGTSKNTLSYNKLSGFKDGNYEIKEILGDLTVKKANTLTVSATGYKGIYDGNSHSASAIPSVSKGTTVYYQTDGGQWTTKVPSITDVGEKTVSVKAENPNYETATAGPVTLLVTPKEVTVTARNKEKVYQAADPEFDADVSGKVEGDKFEIQYTLSREKGEAVGTYAITPEGEKTQGNYTVTYKPGTLTITKSGKLTVSATGYEGVYDGASHSASASPNIADGTTVSYKVGDDGTWSTDAPSITDAGTKKVYVKAENPNYETANAETTLKVTRKPVTVTANDASKVFGENDPDKFTADVDGLLGNDKIVFNVKRMAGEDAGTYAITPSGDSEQGNYEVTYKNGTFTIYKSKALTVSAPDYSGEYDGRSHGTTAVAKAGDHPAPTGTKIYYSTSENGPWSEESPEIKDIGTKIVYVKAENPNFETARASATLKVTPKEVTVIADDKSKKYGEKDPELTASVKGTLDGDTVKYQLSRESGNDVGKYTITPSGKEDQGNYTVKYVAGKLEITKSDNLKVTAKGYTGTYDGTSHGASAVAKVGDNPAPDGTTIYYKTGDGNWTTEAPSIKNAGEKTFQVKAVNSNYEDAVDEGVLKVEKRKVTLTSETASKTFDGTPLTRPDVTVSGDGFVPGELDYKNATGSITKVGGPVDNKIEYKLKDGFKSDNYEVTLKTGTLTITKIPASNLTVEVKANDHEWTYDGQSHSDNGFKVEKGLDELQKINSKFTVKADVKGTVKNVSDTADSNNKVTDVKIMLGDQDVTDQFAAEVITKKDGKLTVSPKPVTLSSASVTRSYNGKELTSPEVQGKDGFVAGELKSAVATGKITEAGSVKNNIEFQLNNGFREDNYAVTLNPGTLTITKVTGSELALEVTAAGGSWKYDGKSHEKKEFSVTSGLEELKAINSNLKVDASVSGSVVNVKDNGENKITDVKIMLGDKDVTDQFESDVISRINGTLTINPRNVTLTSESGTKKFDGNPLTKPEVKVGGDGFVEGEVSDVKATGTITKVGDVTNTIEFTKKSGFKDENYNITKSEGTLTVTKNEDGVVINPKTVSKVYDGKPLTAGYDWTAPAGYTVEVTTEGSVTDAGTAANTVKSYTIRDKAGEDVTDQFKPVITTGTLTVTKKDVHLVSAGGSKEYDGTPLTSPEVKGQDGFVEGEVSDVKATGSITEAGSVKNEITYTEGDKFNKDNYNITKDEGTLEIKANTASLEAKAFSKKRIYNGEPLNAENGTLTGALPAGHTAEVVSNGETITNAGTVSTVVKQVIIRNADGKDVTDQFTGITKKDGKLEVTKRTVNLKSDSASKNFDGTPLTRPDVTVSGDGFVPGEVSDIRATGSITKKGVVENSITFTPEKSYKAENYDLHKEAGKLQITMVPVDVADVKVKAAEGTWVYDGTAHSDGGFTVSGLDNMGEGFTVDAKVTGSVTNVSEGTVANHIASAAIMYNGEDVTDQFASGVKTEDGKLTITPKPVSLKSQSASKAFDGKALKAPDVEFLDGTSFVKGEATAVATGSIIKKGSVSNTIEIKGTPGKYQEDNYDISKTEGTLTVTENENAIVISAGNASKTYDGTPLKAAAEVTAPEGYTVEAVTDGAITNVGTAVNKVVSWTIINEDGEDVTDQFKPVTNEGKLVVTKRNVTLESGSAYKSYDKKPLTSSEMSVSGDGFAPGEGAEYDFTGTQTEKGESENTFTYKLHENTLEGNYNIEVKYGKLVVDDPILYTATIHYRDAAGNTLAPDFAGKYMAGDSFTITSPAVPGYTPQQTYVTMDSMPERDVEVTVVYTANAVPGPGPGPGPSPIPTVVPGIAPGPIAAAPGGAAIVSGPAGDGLTQLKDVKTAKGLKELHEKCNILPFLFMLLTMIVVIAYSKAMKKDQEEIFQLKEELESRRRF